MFVAVLLFQQGTEWGPVSIDSHPSLALRLYGLFVLVSLVVAFANVCRNWILSRPFKRIEGDARLRIAVVFGRQALGLRRWMVLNTLAWATATVAGLLNLLRGLTDQRFVGLPLISLGLQDMLEPSVLFLSILIVLYVARWHILWRAERLDRPQ